MIGCIFLLFWVHGVVGKLPCEYLTTLDGNIVAPSNRPLCLGACPEGNLEGKGNHIYIGAGQMLHFGTFVMKTGADDIHLFDHEKNAILSCYAASKQCFAGMVPPGYPDASQPSGLYLTGTSGGKPTSPFDPWVAKSTIQLDGESTLQSVSLVGVADDDITGWRIVTGDYSYTFTNRQQLIVGDVPAATILAHEDARVIADGPVVVRKATAGCAVPIFRPEVPSLVIVYTATNTTDLCDFSDDPKAFTMTVEFNRCYPRPAGSPFAGPYFKADDTDIKYYANAACSGDESVASEQFGPICQSTWSRIKFQNNKR